MRRGRVMTRSHRADSGRTRRRAHARLLDRVPQRHRRRGTAVARPLEPYTCDTVLDTEQLDVAAVRAEIRPHVVQRLAHARLDVDRVEVVDELPDLRVFHYVLPPTPNIGECTRFRVFPLPRYMCTPHGRHGSKLRTVRMMSTPRKFSWSFSSKIFCPCTASSYGPGVP